MKKSVCILVTLTALSLSALAQAPSPAPAPDGARSADGRRGQMGERQRWGGPGGGMENREFGLERLMGAIASGQDFGKKLNLTAEQQELIKRLVLEQRTKMIDQQALMQKSALKQTEVLMADPLDEAALMAAVEETSKARTAIAKAQIQILIDVRKVLTEEQRKTLREMMMQAKQQPPMRAGEERREGRPDAAGSLAHRNGVVPRRLLLRPPRRPRCKLYRLGQHHFMR
jgi:Spy/CpxP family protein refolding chaperone